MNVSFDVIEVSRITNLLLNEKYCISDLYVDITEITDNGRDQWVMHYGDESSMRYPGRHMGFTIRCILIDNVEQYNYTFICNITELSVSRQLFCQLLAEGIAGAIVGHMTTGDSFYKTAQMHLTVQQIEVQYNRTTPNLIPSYKPTKPQELLCVPESFIELGERKLDI